METRMICLKVLLDNPGWGGMLGRSTGCAAVAQVPVQVLVVAFFCLAEMGSMETLNNKIKLRTRLRVCFMILKLKNSKLQKPRAFKKLEFKGQFIVRLKGLEPPRLAAPDPKSGVATNYTTDAFYNWDCKNK